MQKFLGACFHEHGADEAWVRHDDPVLESRP